MRRRLATIKYLYSVQGLLALCALGFGIVLLLQRDTFTLSRSYAEMKRWGTELRWGVGAVVSGSLHVAMMLGNVRRVVRILSWLVLVAFWCFVAGTLVKNTTWTTGLTTYGLFAIYAVLVPFVEDRS